MSKSSKLLRLFKQNELMSKIPIDLDPMGSDEVDKEILRAAIIAELDAVNLYEQMADKCFDSKIKKVLLDVAREEKTHVGEFQEVLLGIDPECASELEKGKKEIS